MRKVFIISFFIFLSVALISGSAYALTGVCSSCHTMHNSQDGLAQAQVYESGTLVTTDTPQRILLKGDCIGCHTSATGDTIVSNTPIVFNTGTYPATPLAGGNFHSSTETNIHNVKNMKSADSKLLTPPGFMQSAKPTAFTETGTGWGPADSWASGAQVTCAGEYGCHGRRFEGTDDYAGIRGGHHNNKSTFADLDGSTVGKSFRFLAGIRGAEDSDWEKTNSSTDHNGYYGSAASGNNSTISYLCGECHGKFHAWTGGAGEVGTASPWLRHPTDIELKATTGSTFTTDYTTYNVETPVALATPSTSSSTVDTSSIVICLSCHRAHGTDEPEPDILRFTYNMQAGGGGTTGCLRCHKGQR